MTKKTHKKHNSLRGRYKCPACSKPFMMDYAYKNHIKHCVEEDKDEQ